MVSLLQEVTLLTIVLFGLVVALGIVGTVIYDLIALRKQWRTVSRECLYLGAEYPWVACLMTGVLCLALGMLLGHLFLGQGP